MIRIYKVENGEQLEQVRILWREFADLLKSRLHRYLEGPSFRKYMENYEKEIVNHLPGRFGPPKGCLLLAEYQSEIAGCVGLMDLGGGICEMRRLYVRPQYRKSGIGKALAAYVIEQGRDMGYISMRLNTNKKMTGAEELYRYLGFKDIEPYEHFEIDCMVFLELKLQ
ncbi:MAG: GNAT family N-acetyltransferase [Sedimentisphaerales bacterium]|nr:GNAT family N-acetyltransferase [Sedimentisphaerales bacterium]